ncbi:unnamed protein product [Acanthoscelides obtectus]|uniref:Uncharacterized protein n=1 Tax=Acanthoscelides obtectus TaxID=200917 RepID=A0A9P0MJU3_ACAOB|nr:unnamed protein product [Acanthoscelides obtectus]CAK1671589.1 hypothetical protein AOBTE_LOCUS28344 [Acanthoscelides obtectus]
MKILMDPALKIPIAQENDPSVTLQSRDTEAITTADVIQTNATNLPTSASTSSIGNSSRARKRSRNIVKAVSDLKSLHEQVNSDEENPLDVFRKSVAWQLKTFSVENALLAKCRIQCLLSKIGIKDYREKSAPNNSSQRSSSVFSNFIDVSYTSTASTDHVTNRFDDLTSESDTLRTTNDIITLAMAGTHCRSFW